MKILAVTACPLGMVHTYIAAEMIQQSCTKAGIECKVETQGTIGIENELTEEDINTADAVILTTDMPIKKNERFNNMKKTEINIAAIIKNSDEVLQNVLKNLAY